MDLFDLVRDILVGNIDGIDLFVKCDRFVGLFHRLMDLSQFVEDVLLGSVHDRDFIGCGRQLLARDVELSLLLETAAEVEQRLNASLRVPLVFNIVAEDRAIIENLRPFATPDTLTKELLTPGDAPIVRYREHLKTWEKKGWRIDWPALQNTGDNVAYAIPSPARRESRNWVLDTIPTVPTGS